MEEAGVFLIDCIHKTPDYKIDGFPYVGIPQLNNGRINLSDSKKISLEDFEEWTKKVIPKTYDVVLSRRCNPGETAYVQEGQLFALGQNLVILRVDGHLIFPSFFRWLVKGNEWWGQVNKFLNVGAIFNSLKISDILKFELAIPPLEEQGKIAKILGDLDDKIELNNQINKTLEEMAHALFKSWFVDFDPVKAKISADKKWKEEHGEQLTPSQKEEHSDFLRNAAMSIISGKSENELSEFEKSNPEKYKELADTADLFPATLEESPLGPIPSGWEVGKLSDLINFNPPRFLKKGTNAPYLDMKNVPTIGHLANEVICREMNSGTKFINGDTLLARITPCLENGKTAFVDFLKENEVGWGSTEYIVLRPLKNISPSIGYFIARNESFRNFAIQSMTGTSGRQRANSNALSDLEWIKYPIEILNVFAMFADKYLLAAKEKGFENKVLAQTRDTLLPRLLSGEIDLSSTGVESII